MKRYGAVIFDLFDTIINFNPSRLPSTHVNGIETRSTSAAVFEVFKSYYRDVSFEEFYKPFIDSYVEFQQIKLETLKEFNTGERFKLMLRKMKIEESGCSSQLIEEMVLAHMGRISDAVDFPNENRCVLDLLKSNYRLAMISNFDHAPTAYSLLERFGITEYFQEIVISMEIGWRKPKPEIFHECLSLLGIKPDEAIFVGDNFQADVVGSKAVGMDVIWINRKGETISKEYATPDFTVREFQSIKKIFEVS